MFSLLQYGDPVLGIDLFATVSHFIIYVEYQPPLIFLNLKKGDISNILSPHAL